jgi:hypothetical protein
MAWTWTEEDKDQLKAILEEGAYYRPLIEAMSNSDWDRRVNLTDLERETGLPYALILDFARKMNRLSVCSYYIGRKGWPTRLEFLHGVSAVEVGKIALAECEPIETADVSSTSNTQNQFLAKEISEHIADAKRSLANAIGVSLESIDIRVQLKGEVILSG